MIELSPIESTRIGNYIRQTCGVNNLSAVTKLHPDVLHNTFSVPQRIVHIAPGMAQLITDGFIALGITPPQIQSTQRHRSARTVSLIDSYRHLLN
jgi:hypothetical protein